MNNYSLKEIFLLAGIIIILFFAACSKDVSNPTVNNLTTPNDTLSGKEFIFDDLKWEFYDDVYNMDDAIYVSTPARPGLFYNAIGQQYYRYLKMDVSIKFDASVNWILLENSASYKSPIPTPYYYQIAPPSLIVTIFPLDHQLVGKRVSIKVKFL